MRVNGIIIREIDKIFAYTCVEMMEQNNKLRESNTTIEKIEELSV